MPSPHFHHIAGAMLALGLVASLAACSSPVAEPSLIPTKTEAAPVFASDDEAFAAAEEAYARFLEVDMDVSARFGENPEALEAVASGSALARSLDDAAQFADLRVRTEGTLVYEIAGRVDYVETPDRGAVVKFNSCEDSSGASVWREDGSQVTPGDGDTVFPWIVTVEGRSASDLKVSERLQRGTFCF